MQLSELFREHKLTKEVSKQISINEWINVTNIANIILIQYVAQVAGWPRKDEGIIDAPLCIKGVPPTESVQLAERKN